MIDISSGDLNGVSSRFGWVTDRLTSGPLPVFDEPLVSNSEAVAVPSLGSIVAGWTLLVPRAKCINFRNLSISKRQKLSGLRQLIHAKLLAGFGGTIYEFEHGPAEQGGTLGCGVDQAHLHMVPLRFDVLEKVSLLAGRKVEVPSDLEDPWTLIPENVDYIYVRDTATNRGTIVLPEVLESQKIRRIVAEHAGPSSQTWDYRKAPGLAEALKTRDAFAGTFFHE
jgi:diadenosine tetraphosphate (Ap4A) HIT family hydrolase